MQTPCGLICAAIKTLLWWNLSHGSCNSGIKWHERFGRMNEVTEHLREVCVSQPSRLPRRDWRLRFVCAILPHPVNTHWLRQVSSRHTVQLCHRDHSSKCVMAFHFTALIFPAVNTQSKTVTSAHLNTKSKKDEIERHMFHTLWRDSHKTLRIRLEVRCRIYHEGSVFCCTNVLFCAACRGPEWHDKFVIWHVWAP